MKDKVRPIYKDLQAYLSQLPLPNEENATLYDQQKEIWENFNSLIQELNTVSNKDYNNFKLNPHVGNGYAHISLVTVRTTIGRIVARLHAEYFSDEQEPFSGTPSTVISQTQTQQQSIDIRFLMDLGSKIDEKLKSTTDEKEIGFLEKLKLSLPNLKSGIEILRATIDLAEEFGLNPSQLSDLLH